MVRLFDSKQLNYLGGQGDVTVSNGASLTVNNNLVVGNAGTGALVMQDSWTTILVHGNYVIGSVRRHRGTGKRNRESNGWHYSLRWREQSQCHRLNEYDLSGDGVVNAGGVFMAKGTDSRGIFRLGDTGQVNSFNNPIPGTSFTASGNIEVGIGSGSDGQVYQSGGAVNTNTIF